MRLIDFFSRIELMELCGWGTQVFRKTVPEKIMVDLIGIAQACMID